MTEDPACNALESALPWYVNGALPDVERATLEAHLGTCARCRAALTAEERFARAIGDTGSVELAPQAAMRRFFERLDAGAKSTASPAPPRRRTRLALLLAAQACLVLGTGVWLGERLHAPAYVTESAPPEHRDRGPRMRLVLDPATPLAGFEAILQRLDARVVAGPSESRVYTLAFPEGTTADEVKAHVAHARQEPGVTFAEPVAAGVP